MLLPEVETLNYCCEYYCLFLIRNFVNKMLTQLSLNFIARFNLNIKLPLNIKPKMKFKKTNNAKIFIMFIAA